MSRRAVGYSRRRAVIERSAIWHSKKRVIVLVVVAYVLLSVFSMTLAGLIVGREAVWFIAGGAVAAVVPLLRDVFGSNEYRRLTDAALAEEFTASELRHLRFKGWKRLDRVEFYAHDVDHVIVGAGGVYAIETKYTNVPWPITDNRFNNIWANEAVAQARRNADNIKSLLTQKLKATYDVQPLLMIWGDGRPKLDEPITVDRGVVVVTGRLLRKHLNARPASLGAKDVDRIARELRQFVNGKEAADRARRMASA